MDYVIYFFLYSLFLAQSFNVALQWKNWRCQPAYVAQSKSQKPTSRTGHQALHSRRIISSNHLHNHESRKTSSSFCFYWKQRIFPQLFIQYDHHVSILNHINDPLAKSTPCFLNRILWLHCSHIPCGPCFYRCESMCVFGCSKISRSEGEDVPLIKGFSTWTYTLVWIVFFPMGIQGSISICWLYEPTMVSAGTSVGPVFSPSHRCSLSYVYSAGQLLCGLFLPSNMC